MSSKSKSKSSKTKNSKPKSTNSSKVSKQVLEEKSPLPKLKEEKKDVELDYSLEDVDDNEIVEEIDYVETQQEDLSKVKERYEYKPVISREIVIMHPDNRKTSEIMTMYEYTNIISQRAEQVNNGGICFTETEGVSDPIEMARKELHDKKCPLDVLRHITENIYEKWSANELTIPIEAQISHSNMHF